MKKISFIIIALFILGSGLFIYEMKKPEISSVSEVSNKKPVVKSAAVAGDREIIKISSNQSARHKSVELEHHDSVGQESVAGNSVATEQASGKGLTYRVSNKRPRGRLADPDYRMGQVRKKSAEAKYNREAAIIRAKRDGWYPVDQVGDPEQGQLMGIRNGKPLVYHVENMNAAISTAADLVRDSSIYGIQGSNVVAGLWDAGSVRSTHVEFTGGRVAVIDSSSMSSHSTHVCGTLIASGVYLNAKGMATAGRVESYNWFSDLAEMTGRAMADVSETNQLQVSNHSYGVKSGWYYGENSIEWYGTWGEGIRISDSFGNYSYSASSWDELCYDAPYFLPVKSAGNDRNDSAPSTGTTFKYFDGFWKSKTYDPATDPLSDYSKGGYDTIPDVANAKNILTVGAVNDAVSGTNRSLAQATMTPYSGWGPADDGRIKPDIVGNGAVVHSTDSGSDNGYLTLSGTSMASPNVAGSAMLLIGYYKKLFNAPITSALLKGLIIHTADDIGRAGPDYSYGWGLMNTKAAAEHIRLQSEYPDAEILHEDFLDTNNAVRNISIVRDNGNPIKVTICWTDPAGDEQAGLDNRTSVLVNDLDLRIISPGGVTNFPFTLNVTNPTAVAVAGDNILDNIEQIIIPAPDAGDYTISVSHKGMLDGGVQYYALLISGAAAPPVITHEPLVNTTNDSSPYLIEADIRSLNALKPDSPVLFWSTNSFASVAGSNLMVNVSNDIYSSSIPAYSLGTEVSYYIYAETSNSLSTVDPIDAPVTMHSFIVAPPVRLDVWGSPGEIGVVNPDYGASVYPSGLVVHASASAVTPENMGHRYASGGWLGANDVPAEGVSNSVTFVIGRNSAMFWKWISQYSLVQTSSVSGIINTTNWCEESSYATSITAAVEVINKSVSYHFAEWQVDGLRQPGATNIAVNPVIGLLMETSHVATAVYLPTDEDSDIDGLPDWWERYYFGSLLQAGEDDPDGDGYLNIEEFEDKSNPRDPLSFPTGPEINHVPLSSTQSNPAPWTVTAEVIDNNAVDSVLLKWRRNGLNWRQTIMAAGAVSNQYVADIPAPGLLDDSFEYMIMATDLAGYYAEDGPHNLFVAYPVIDILQTNSFAFFMLKNRMTNSVFSIGNNGNANLEFNITMESVGIWSDIEGGTNGWQHYGSRDNWNITTNRHYSGSSAWYCGDVQDFQYDNGEHASLVTPKILLADNSKLSFMHWIQSELDMDPYVWDGGVVEISVDNGTTYQMLTPEGGYPKLVVNNPDSPFVADTPCFGGTGGWERVVVDLSAYSGKEAMIRFRFGADLFVVAEGWYIDDVQVTPLGITNDWISLDITQGNIPATASMQDIVLSVNTTNLPPRYSDALMLAIRANDPLVPLSYVLVSLQVESRPEVELLFAEQTSRDGTGIVTVSNKVYDADYDLCSLELVYSLDNGMLWTNMIIAGASAAEGSVGVSNDILPQLRGILTTNIIGSYTNAVTATWSTTNNIDAILLATNVLVSCRAWDGKYWSDPVSSAPFIIDNELPIVPAILTVLSHEVGIWSTNRTFLFNWTASSDGDGIGIDGYRFAVTNIYNPQLVATNFTELLSTTDASQYDGTNLWVAVAAVDIFGNKSAAQISGPFMVDSIPPSSQAASIQFVKNAFGDYVIGTSVDCSWSGFSDNLSGISGYYIDTLDNPPTTNDYLTIELFATVSNTIPDQTNNVYVWAVDNVGLVSTSAIAPILILSEENDYDGDGHNNGEENITGTDANNKDSIFAVREDVVTGASNSYVVVSWNSITNRIYTLLNVSNLNDVTWQTIPTVSNATGVDGVMRYTNSVDAEKVKFYKVKVGIE